MAKYYYFLSVLLFVVGCDQPASRRVITRSNETPATVNNTNSSLPTNNGTNNNTNNNSNTGTSDNRNPTGTVTIPAQYSQCQKLGNNSYEFFHVHIGDYNVCKSSSSQTGYALQLRTPPSNYQICAIPTTNTSNGSSTYIGEPQCFTPSTQGQLIEINFQINRLGYQNSQITGMMIMQDRPYYYPAPYNSQMLAVDAYLLCMNWLAQQSNSSLCETFRTVGTQQNNYVSHQFR